MSKVTLPTIAPARDVAGSDAPQWFEGHPGTLIKLRSSSEQANGA
jgi:hypothetical protein